ncbi:MAG: ABC transporter permease, partial [Acinetobacter sp.]|nr:ABC transporter permease [Acinetobacter sp.]
MLGILSKKVDAQEQQTSPGLWRLAMRRLKADRIAMLSLLVLLCYFIILVLSMTGVIASNWNKEVAVSYAPPTFIGADQNTQDSEKKATPVAALPENPVDPLKDVIKELNTEIATEQASGGAIDYYG